MKWYNGFSPTERIKGDKIVKDAISRGELKPIEEQTCCICGQTKGIKHYHQEDYNPKRVIESSKPLCWRCHMMIHSRFNHPQSFAKYIIDVVIYGKQYEPIYKHNYGLLKEHFID